MKKILMGLMAISTLSLAAPINLGTAPAPDTYLFKNDQVGKIKIEGTITSEVPVIKYVVFATTDDGVTNREDVLQLTEFVMAQKTTGDSGLGFKGINPKIMVKRVKKGDSDIEDLLPSESVTFAVNVDPKYTEIRQNQFQGLNGVVKLTPMALIAYDNAVALATASGIPNLSVYGNGYVGIRGVGGNWYRPNMDLAFTQTSQGVIETTSVVSQYKGDALISAENAKKIETQFAGGQPIANAYIVVRVGA